MNSNPPKSTKLIESNHYNWPLYIFGIGLIVYYIFCWQSGINQVINWQIMSQLEDTTAIIDHFTIGNQSFEIPAKVFYVMEQYMASPMDINLTGSWVWLSIFTVGISLVAATTAQLKNYWYLAASTCIIVIIVSLSIDELFGQTNYLYSGVILFAFISISYLFNWYFTKANLAIRFLTFLSFFVFLGLGIHFFASEPLPFLLLTAKSIPAALVLVTLFIFFIAYDIILAVLNLSTKGGGSHSLLNFSIFTLIYLINLGLTYLHNINYLNWEMLYLSPFLILLISSILGFFLLPKKEPLLEIFKTKYEITFLFGALGFITLGLCSYAFATGNDPLVEVVEDAVMYTHLVMGFCFFAYVFLNFFPLFGKKYEVAKVVFKPLQYPLFYFRGAALLVIFAILINNQFFPVMQSFSGYYNALADHSVAAEQYKLAEAYYKTALGYERQNHKSNYGLGSLAANLGDNPTAGAYYRLAVQKKPTEYAFAALSNSLQKEDLFFEAMFALKDGLKIFPKSGELQNNLALLFDKSKALDSTHLYLEKAKLNAENKDIPNANLLWFYLKNQNKEKQLEALKNDIQSKYNALNSNQFAASLVAGNNTKLSSNYEFDGDSTLNMANFAWLFNQTIFDSKKNIYSTIPFSKLRVKEGNFNLAKELEMAEILNEFYAGDKLKALEILENLNINSDTTATGKYNQVLFNTLLKKAKEVPSQIDINLIKTIQQAENALKADPFNERIVEKAVQVFNKFKQEKSAYDTLIRVLQWQKNSPKLQKLYILQCFKIHMNDYAKDGLEKLKTMNLAEYDSFLPVYQAQIALVEKANEGFN